MSNETVTNSVNTYTSQELKKLGDDLNRLYGTQKANQPLGVTIASGNSIPVQYEDPITFSPRTNYTASDVDTAANLKVLEDVHGFLPGLIGPWKTVQIHETGNSAALLAKNYIGERYNPKDSDSGYVIGRCVEQRLRKK